MRSRLFPVALSVVLGATALLPAFAADPSAKANQAAPAAEHAAPQSAAQHEHTARQDQTDPNFRWHNGRWWYWQNGGWLMWDGARWLNRQERSARVNSRRSFSYTEDAQGFVPTEAGIPQSTASGLRRGTVAPGTVEYQRVVPSYGMRSAGSKVLGNY